MSNYTDGLNLLPLPYIQAVLKSSLKADSTPLCAVSKRIDEGQGFMSFIAQLKLHWPEPINSSFLPDSVVVKFPTPHKVNAEIQRLQQAEPESKMLSFDDVLLHFHNAECNFYQHVAEQLKNRYGLPIGHVYHTKLFESTTDGFAGQFGLIVMEDFVGRGRTPHLGSEPLNDTQLKSIINSIASMHAYCIANPHWNETYVVKNLYAKYYENLSGIARNSLLALREEYPQHLTVTDAEIDLISNGEAVCRQLGIKTDPFKVIVHGDLWVNNLIFAKDKDNRIGDDLLAIIDWQACHPGGVCEDLARLFISSVDPHVRRANTHRLLKRYYKLLKKKVPKGTKIPFSFEKVLHTYKKSFGLGAFRMAILVGIMLNNPYDRRTEQEKLSLIVSLQMCIEDAIAANEDLQNAGFSLPS